MTIWIRPSRVHAPGNDFCDDGPPRVAKMLEALGGLPHDTPMTPAVGLQHLLLTDILFALAYPDKGCEREAAEALRGYMREVCEIAYSRALPELTLDDEAEGVVKRCRGLDRKPLLRRLHAGLCVKKADVGDPACRYAVNAMLCLLDELPDNLSATHATIELVKMGEVSGGAKELVQHLRRVLLGFTGSEYGINKEIRDVPTDR